MVDIINLQYPPEIVQYYSPNYVRRPLTCEIGRGRSSDPKDGGEREGELSLSAVCRP